jgi:transcriptional regulator with XRE-family HTH domain
MKFSRLIGKFESLVNKLEQGSSVIPEKLEKLQQLLDAKKARYNSKLEATEDPKKRRKLETRLKVVAAQLEKSKKL